MDANTQSLFDAIDPLLDRYKSSRLPLSQYFSENLGRVNRDGYTWEQFERGRQELEAEIKAKGDVVPELFRHFEEVCSIYVTSDPSSRAEIRDCVGDRQWLSELFRSYADHLVASISGAQDRPKMRLALAAVLIENCSSDYRDTLTTLADLYVRAEEVGLDPKALFESMSELATDSSTAGGCESLAKMLREFESYAVVGERRRMGRSYRELLNDG